jgi:hypothetical protein
VKAAGGKAAAAAELSANADGSRSLTLADGVDVGSAATAARQSLSRAGFAGVSVRKSGKGGRTLIAYRGDGAPVPAGVDSVILAGVATVA